MKPNISKTGTMLLWVLVTVLAQGCAPARLLDAWQSENFGYLSTSRILVIGENTDPEIRSNVETAIALKLRALKYDAIESYVLFPNLTPPDTPEEQDAIVNDFKKAGINAIVLLTLKQTIETQKEGFAPGGNLPKDYEDKSSFEYGQQNASAEVMPTSTTYVIETLVYNMQLEDDAQLVHVSLIDVTDPDSEEKVRQKISKIIANQFRK